MPNHNTFSIPPIGDFVNRYASVCRRSMDPFARDGKRANITNDLNPDTKADYHMEAEEFCVMVAKQYPNAIDLVLFDPPYSPRQISEVYASIGKKATMEDTQSALLYKNVRDAFMPCLSSNAVVLSFGWNSAGMGKKRGFEIIEILMVAHGGAHNDTICLAERRIPQLF